MEKTNIQEGMVVRSSDGHRLGKILIREADTFTIERGLLIHKEYVAEYSDVADIRDGEVWLIDTKEDLLNRPAAAEAEERGEERKAGEVRMPLAEEELETTKRAREAGEVRIHKDVKTEKREISVPVTKEEARVERIPATEKTAQPGESTFKEETVSVPLEEEEVEIRKRPVVREELRVSKERGVEERRAAETVRKETADIDEEGRVSRIKDPRERE